MIDFGKIAGRIEGDVVDSQMSIVLRWFERPVGDPPMVDIEQDDLLPGGKLRWKTSPLVWPASLVARPLVLISASGGIDSTAAALAVRDRWPEVMIILERSDTGREPSDSEGVLRRLSRKIGAPVVTLRARNELFDLIRWRGLIPNRRFGDWCTGSLKGDWLDRLNYYLVARRVPGSSKHTVGYLWGEGPEAKRKDRVSRHLKAQDKRFGPLLREFVILHEDKIDKPAAIRLIQQAGIPISRVYLDRTRHGCIPCKWWDERLWLSYYHLDPDGFEQAAALEDELARGASNPESVNYRNPPGLALRTWLLPKVEGATADDGRTLRQWVQMWREEGRLDHPPDMGLVRPEDLGDVDPGDRTVHLPSYREGKRNMRRSGQRAVKLRGKMRDPRAKLPSTRNNSRRVKAAQKLLSPLAERHPLLYELVTETPAGPEQEALFLIASWVNDVRRRRLTPDGFWGRVERLNDQLADLTLDREVPEDLEPQDWHDDDDGTEVSDEELSWSSRGAATGAAPRWKTLDDWIREEMDRLWDARGAKRGAYGSIIEVDGRPTALSKHGKPGEGYVNPFTGASDGQSPKLRYADGAHEIVVPPDAGYGEGRYGQWAGDAPVKWQRRTWKVKEATEHLRQRGLMFRVEAGVRDRYGRFKPYPNRAVNIRGEALGRHVFFLDYRYHLADVRSLNRGQSISFYGSDEDYRFTRVR